MEAGLRLSPDQWSSLLYGDQAHRPLMQSICDKLSTCESLGSLLAQLTNAIQQYGDTDSILRNIVPHVHSIALLTKTSAGKCLCLNTKMLYQKHNLTMTMEKKLIQTLQYLI